MPVIKGSTAAAIAVSTTGFLNGYDTGSIGAVTAMDQFTTSFPHIQSPSLHGLTTSIILLASVLPSTVLAGPWADRHGRLPVTAWGALLFLVGVVLQASTTRQGGLAQFILGRGVAGVGQGLFFPSAGVYIAEISPPKRRGVLTALQQFMAVAGVCLGYFACSWTNGAGSSAAWRLPYLVQGFVAALLALAAGCILPESPRWLAARPGRAREAAVSLRMLDFDLDEARRDFMADASAASATGTQANTLSGWQGFALMFKSGYRSRTSLGLFFLGMVQLSGIDAITYYAPILFAQAGITAPGSTFLASGVSSLAMLAISIPAFLLTDKWGRRTSALGGGLGLAGLMFLIGSLYAAGAVHPFGVARWVVVVSVFLFGMTFCATWGIVAKVYATEIQPGNTRAAANSVGMGLNFLTNFTVAFITPILLSASAFGAYFLFGGLALFTVAVLAVYMPETRGRSLENIQESFHRPTTASSALRYMRAMLSRTNGEVRQGEGSDGVSEHELQAQQTRAASVVGNEAIPGGLAMATSSVSVETLARTMRVDLSRA